MKQYRSFFSFIIPSVIAFALSGVYTIADGFFVGNSVGDMGLSTINVSYPVVCLIQSMGTGIGMGGAVLYSIYLARGEKETAEAYVNAAFRLLFFASAAMTVLFSAGLTAVLKFLGARGVLSIWGKEYLRIILFGVIFQMFGTGLLPIIRNHGGAVFAMKIMVLGFLVNIFLDYLFIWRLEWGIRGAAMATVMGQAVTMIGEIGYLRKHQVPVRKRSQKEPELFRKIIRIGLAPFGITMSPILSLLLINRASMLYGGEEAVACYACISYAITILYLLIQGVGDGSQPLISWYFGEGNRNEVRKVRRFSCFFAEMIALTGAFCLFALRSRVGAVFGSSQAVTEEISRVLPIFLIGILFLSFVRIIASYFYAVAQNLFSYILVYAEPVLLLVFLRIFPRFGGQEFVWWSVAGIQILSFVIAVILQRYAESKMKKQGNTGL